MLALHIGYRFCVIKNSYKPQSIERRIVIPRNVLFPSHLLLTLFILWVCADNSNSFGTLIPYLLLNYRTESCCLSKIDTVSYNILYTSVACEESFQLICLFDKHMASEIKVMRHFYILDCHGISLVRAMN